MKGKNVTIFGLGAIGGFIGGNVLSLIHISDEIRRQKQSRYSKVPMPKMQRYASGTSGLYISIQAVRSRNHYRCFGRAYYLRNAWL